jgi:hypothetical protein
MADKKISELPLLNSVSGSSLVIPIVHDGTTVKVNLSQLGHYASQWSAKTGSANTFTGNQTIVGNLVVSGDLTAERYYIETISSSVIYESGSTVFGNSGDDTHTFTGSIILNGATIGAAELNSFTASQLAVNLGISSVTGSINTTTASFDSVFLGISSVSGAINTTTSSFDSVFLGISSVSGAINTTTSSFDSVFLGISSVTGAINTTTSSFDSEFAKIGSTTASLHFTTSSLNSFTGSIIGQNNTISTFTSSVNFTTQSLNTQTGSQDLVNTGISSVTGSINTTTSSFDSVFLGISSVTGSLIGITNTLMAFTAALDSTYATDAQLYELYQATASIHFATSSLNSFSGSIQSEVGGIESYTASLKAAAIVSSSTQIQNYNLFALDANVAVKTSGSTLYSTSPSTTNFSQVNSLFLGGGAGQDATSADSSIFLGYNAGIQATAAQESFFAGNTAGGYATNALRSNFIGISAGGAATNASNANFIGYGVGQSATNASYANFIGSNAGFIATNATYANFIGGSAGQNATNASYSNFIGNFTGDGAANASYSNLFGFSAGKKVFGNGIGANNIIIGTNITLENDRRDSINFGGIIFATGSYRTTSGNPYSGSVGYGKVGINKVLPSFELDISGSVGITGSLKVSDGITGSLYSTNGVISSSNQLFELNTQTGSQDLVNLGISTFTGSLRSEVNLIEAYTASLKAAEIVSSSTQVQNYDVFALNSNLYESTGSIKGEIAGIEAYTASLKGAIEVSGQDVNVLGMITAQQFNVTLVSSSVLYQSGSTKFGNTSDDRHEFTGSLHVTGSSTFNSTTAKVMEVQSGTSTGGYVRFTYNGSSNSIGYIGNSNQLSGVGTVSDFELRADNNLTLTAAAAISTSTPSGSVYQVRSTNGPSGDHIFKSYNTQILKLDGGTNTATFADNIILASGKGIDFSATSNSSGTMTSELLNDYEEGTWTPGLSAGTSGTITVNTGNSKASYTKIGRAVTLQCFIEVSSVSSPVGRLSVTGFPFTAGSNLGDATAAVYNTGFTGNPGGWPILRVQPGTTAFIDIQESDGTNPAIDLSDHITTGTELIFSVTYFV